MGVTNTNKNGSIVLGLETEINQIEIEKDRNKCNEPYNASSEWNMKEFKISPRIVKQNKG